MPDWHRASGVDFSPDRIDPALAKFLEGRKAAGQASLDLFG